MKRFLVLPVFTILALASNAFADTNFAPKKEIQPAATLQPIIVTSGTEGPVASKQSAPTGTSAAAAPNQVSEHSPLSVVCTTTSATTEYQIGTNDVLDVNILQPEPMQTVATVSPDGTITFPYIGTVRVRGKTLAEIQDNIQTRLADGFMKYPVVSVSLKESHSRRFFVYGEVIKPGAYDMEENMTALRGISMAGGFTQFGSASRVKILRPKMGAGGYDVIKVNIKDVMDGVPDTDLAIVQGDIIVVSEGIF